MNQRLELCKTLKNIVTTKKNCENHVFTIGRKGVAAAILLSSRIIILPVCCPLLNIIVERIF